MVEVGTSSLPVRLLRFEMPTTSTSGIKTTADGASFIPASKRADGSTRKEIRVRPGYRPPEDVETYKNRSAEARKNRGQGGIPGAEGLSTSTNDGEAKSKNAKRREAARRKAAAEVNAESDLASAMHNTRISDEETVEQSSRDPNQLAENAPGPNAEEAERQKKIRNQLKKLKAVRQLKEKKAVGDKLSHDQIIKISKESELLRDLKKLDYDGPEIQPESSVIDRSAPLDAEDG